MNYPQEMFYHPKYRELVDSYVRCLRISADQHPRFNIQTVEHVGYIWVSVEPDGETHAQWIRSATHLFELLTYAVIQEVLSEPEKIPQTPKRWYDIFRRRPPKDRLTDEEQRAVFSRIFQYIKVGGCPAAAYIPTEVRVCENYRKS